MYNTSTIQSSEGLVATDALISRGSCLVVAKARSVVCGSWDEAGVGGVCDLIEERISLLCIIDLLW